MQGAWAEHGRLRRRRPWLAALCRLAAPRFPRSWSASGLSCVQLLCVLALGPLLASVASADGRSSQPFTSKRGPVAESAAFRAFLELPAPLKVGRAGELRVVLEGIAPYKCNEKYPQKFVLERNEAVRFEQTTVREVQFSQQRALMRIPVAPLRPGPQEVSGLLSFSVCSDSECLIEKRRLSLKVDVQPNP